MNDLELVVTERNRLVRYSIITSIAGVILAIWARDPLLNVPIPFGGINEENITVGHAVLIGHPMICILFLVMVAQAFRYKTLVARLPSRQREHLDWKYDVRNDEGQFIKYTRVVCEICKFVAMISLPAIASFFLLFSQFDFENIEMKGKEFSYRHIFSDEFYDIKPSYKKLWKDCDSVKPINKRNECEGMNEQRKPILDRMPKLYQPFNLLGGLILQVFVVAALISMLIRYFSFGWVPKLWGAAKRWRVGSGE